MRVCPNYKQGIATGSPRSMSDGYAMLMGLNIKGETAVHGCHYPGDRAVRMREVLARLGRGLVYVCPLLDAICSYQLLVSTSSIQKQRL